MELPVSIVTSLRQRGHRWDRIESLAGDVGRRRYLRLQTEGAQSHVLALYPPDQRDACRRFEITTGALIQAGVRVPEVVDADCGAGWMLVEDLGPRTLFDRYRLEADLWHEILPWYMEAVRISGRIARIPARIASLNPPLDRQALLRELDQTWTAFLEPAGLRRHEAEGAPLSQLLEEICSRLTSEPLVPCHRDFMARNLVPLGFPAPGELGVLDHQDLRLGPRWYDLASLLNDSLFPPTTVELSVLEKQKAASGLELLSYRRAAAQRTLKAVGTFARHVVHRDLIRPTLQRALEHMEKLPEAGGFLEALHALRERFDLLD